MQFRLLGPLEVRDEGGVVPIAGYQARALLCMLLLDAGRVVSMERLIDALWGESPPPAAVHGLHVQASKLRAALRNGGGATVQISTEAGGYRLQLDGHEFDVTHLEQLVAEGRRELAADRAAAAVSTLRAAESLWRGPPLADFANAAFAQPAITKLNELRRTAVETRIEAQLAAGDAVAVVPELEELAAADPLREQLRSLQMRALYQAGQQARALEVYRETRERLADELGVDPSPELQQLMQDILVHEPALRGPPPVPVAAAVVVATAEHPATAEDSFTRPGAEQDARAALPLRRPGRRWALVGGVAVLAAGTIAGIVAARGNGGGMRARWHANVVSEYDLAGHLRAQFPVGNDPSAITAGAGSLWVTNQDDDTVTRIDLTTGREAVVGDIGDTPAGIAFGAGSAWVVSPTNVAHGATATGTVTPINPATATATEPFKAGQQAGGITYGDGSLWVAATEEARVYRFNPALPAKPAAFDVGTAPTGIAVSTDAVWVTNAGDNTVSELDPMNGTSLTRDPYPVGTDPVAVAAGRSGAWVANYLDDSVTRIDPVTRQIETIPVGAGPSAIAVTDDAVWVASDHASTIEPIDPATDHVAQPIPVPGAPRAILAVGDRLYVASATSYQGHTGGRLRVLLAGPRLGKAFPVIDPTLSEDFVDALVSAATSDTLVAYERAPGVVGNSLVPDLVRTLPPATPRATSYPFTLVPGIHFSTGQLLRASDIRSSFERAMLEDPADVDASSLPAIRGASACLKKHATSCDLSAGIKINDARGTVRFELTHPDPQFLASLANGQATIVPAGTPVVHDINKQHPIVPGTGPYRVSDFAWPKRIVLTRNPHFHQWSRAAQPDGYPNSIVIETAPASPQNLADLEHGKIDVLRDQSLTPTEVQQAVSGYPVVKRDEGGIALRFAFLNEKLAPFNKLKARRAINYAVDRHKFIVLRQSPQNLQPTCQINAPGVTGYRPYCPYTANPDAASDAWTGPNLPKAKQLVRESGTLGDRVVVWQPPTDYKAEPSASYLVQVLNDIGYHATLRPPFRTFADYMTAIVKGQAQIGALGFGLIPDGVQQFPFWTCQYSDQNPGRYCNHGVDELNHRAVSMELTNPQRARTLAADTDKALVDDAAILPIWSESDYTLVSSRVGNWSTNFSVGILLSELWVK